MYSLNLAEQTDGAYDPTIGPLVNLWGFGPDGSKKVPTKTEIADAKNHVGFSKVKIQKSNGEFSVEKETDKVYVDLSSSAKGFGVDKVSELLTQKGIKNHLVEIGGELRAKGKKFKKNWIVGVEKPAESAKAVQIAFALKNMSIATSGDYRNFFKEKGRKYSHTIDQKTGRPVQHKLFSVTVLDQDCIKADALATALMALGPDKAKNFAYENAIPAYLIYEDSTGELTEHQSPVFKELSKQ